MQLTRVQSSMIYAVGYDAPCERLEVVYFNSVYRYYDVPQSIFEALLAAESKGRYMHDHILGKYPYRRLESEATSEVEGAEEQDDRELADAPHPIP
jgi:hypothetical protein